MARSMRHNPIHPDSGRLTVSAGIAAAACGLVAVLGSGRAAANEPLLWDGLFADGSRITGGQIVAWNAPASQPQLGGKPIFDASNPARWIVRQGRAAPATVPAAQPVGPAGQPFVELACGDRLPGMVEGHASGLEDWRRVVPPHLLVRPLSSVDLPGRPPRPHVRVASEQVRRVVLVPRVGSPPPPATVLLADGREFGFRSLRFAPSGVILLGEEGTQRLSFDEIAEIHMAERDPWDLYERMMAWLAPGLASTPGNVATGRLLRAETDDGLLVTTAAEPLRATGDSNNPRSWHQMVRPAWSLDPLWLPHASTRSRIVFAAHEPPLSLIEPASVERKAVFGGSWTWLRDRNVQGSPLAANRLAFGWGFGTQARSVMTFPLPDFATGFRSLAALDDAAGAGGCVKASVHLASANSPPLWTSDFMVGSREPLDTGKLPIPPPAGQNGPSLVLVADTAHEGRPESADSHDIRDIFDWLDPVVSLVPERLAAAVGEQLPATMPAWRDWEVEGRPMIRTIVDPVAAVPDMPATLRQSLAVGGTTVLRRRFEVSAETTHLVIGVTRTAASASRLEVRFDGTTFAEADVPERKPGGVSLPFVVPLAGFVGRTPLVEIVHRATDDKGFVEWASLGPVGSPGTRWQPLPLTSVTSEGRAMFRTLDDGSVVASGPSATRDVHTLEIDTDLDRITAIRLEALRDDSLPAGGPGRAAKGGFILQAIEGTATSRSDPARERPLGFTKALATFATPGFAAEMIVDANPASGWSINGIPKNVEPAVILSLAEPIRFTGGARLKLVLRYGSGAQQVLGRFRLSATADPDPQFGLPATLLEPVPPAPAKP